MGKTHLLSRYTRGTLPKAPQATIGVEFATQMVTLEDGTQAKAQIWDTAGQERYRAIIRHHYRRAVGALLVYDVTNRQSFANVTRWLEEIRQHAEPDIVVMLVGNKLDLVIQDPSCRRVEYEVAAQYAQRNNLRFYEASAVSTHNVKQVFESLLQEIYNLKSANRKVDKMGMISGGVGIGPASNQAKSTGFADLYNNELQGGIKLSAQNDEKEQSCC